MWLLVGRMWWAGIRKSEGDQAWQGETDRGIMTLGEQEAGWRRDGGELEGTGGGAEASTGKRVVYLAGVARAGGLCRGV